ncbi:MAG TPA: DUF1080 domain-containing protein [Fodinibius sp.]|nr:DUF1080 domain-containing protein [Fodinibius sp.]
MSSDLQSFLLFLVISCSLSTSLYAQFPEPAANEDAGFKQILTKETFDDWHGKLEYWRFEDGVLIGEVKEDGLLDENTFLVWEQKVEDFELKVEYRVSPEGNSGINYRSKTVGGKRDVLKGYQADLDGPNRWSGQLYEEKGREFLALRGQITYIGQDDVPYKIGSLGKEEELAKVVNKHSWNEYHLIVQGNTLIHLVNGRVVSVAIDEGPKSTEEGLLGLQIHQGPSMKIEYRNLRIKEL